jgi:prophage antirepressor-like protein
MREIEILTEHVFNDVDIRATDSYMVYSDLRKSKAYTLPLDRHLKAVEDMGQHVYTGMEKVQTPGGPQMTRVVYRRGAFHLLMYVSADRAIEFQNYVFDLLEGSE